MCRNHTITVTVFASVLLLSSTPARAQSTWHVDAALATGANDGTSWADAFQGRLGLQAALGVAVPDDQVWVAAGVYAPHASNQTVSFELESGVAIYGGFPNGGGDGTFGARDPDPENNGTILSGDLNNDDLPDFVNYAENSYHVTTGSGTDNTAVLDGFTITAGNST
ncbi:MAG: hypothetical protein ABIG44_14915, partial [Planctomycetota bacterium]